MDLAEPGEDRYPTRLYSPIWTPMNQMGDYGLGVSHHRMAEETMKRVKSNVPDDILTNTPAT